MPSRYVCDVLEEMRALHKTRNYASLLGLVEEAQTMVNRMEAALGSKRDCQKWHDKEKKAKKAYLNLVKEANKLRRESGQEEISTDIW